MLTKKKYLERYNNSSFRQFLKIFFAKYAVLFLGYSLRDGEVKNIIYEANSLSGDSKKKHFVLIPKEDGISPSEITFMLDMYKMHVIVYGSRNDFPHIMRDWINKTFVKTKLREGDMSIP